MERPELQSRSIRRNIMALRDFTDEEMSLLSRVIKREKQGVVNTQNRPSEDESQDYLAPEHYIAAIVDEGIPALTPDFSSGSTGTGTGTEPASSYDMPGRGLCNIYRIIDGLLRPAGFTKIVYNLTSSAISEDWFTVSRDKYGNWIANLGGSSTIVVKIVETAPGTGSFGTGSGLGDPVAVYKTSHPGGFSVIALDENYDEVGSNITCYADELINVHYTGSIVRMQKHGTRFQIVTTGENHWHDAFTNDPIDVDGSGEVQMFDNGPSVQATTGMPVSQYVFCQLLFDNQAQVFYVGNQGCDTNNPGTGT